MTNRKDFNNLSKSQRNRRLTKCDYSLDWINGKHHELQLTRHNAGQVSASHNSNSQYADDTLTRPADVAMDMLTVSEVSEANASDTEKDERAISSNNAVSETASQSSHKTDDDQEHSFTDSDLKQQLAEWACDYSVKHNAVNALLKILNAAGLEKIPLDARTLLGTPKTTVISYNEPGKYFHYGMRNAIIDQLKLTDTSLIADDILININIDGLPISKSSKSQLWPILGQIFPTVGSPFVIGAYHGESKPAVNAFLREFITEYTMLHNEGFQYFNRHYTVTIRAVICDSPARSYVTCTKAHNGHFGCGKCAQEGEYRNHRMLFLERNAMVRTDAQFQQRLNEDHHAGESLFEEVGLGMVSQFPLDYMHLVCLGVMKKLLQLWLGGYHSARFTGAMVKQISIDLREMAKWIPVEFARKTRGLDELDRWKATELRLFLLYVGAVVLHKYLPESHLLHLCSLQCAIRILCHKTDCIQNNAYADELLNYFVATFSDLYGEETIIYNVHNLIHLAADVRKHGHLDSFSAFPFENHRHAVKQLLRKADNPLQQLHNRIVERAACSRKIDKDVFIKPVVRKRNGDDRNGALLYSKIYYQHFVITLTKTGNDCCFLKNGNLIRIKYIGERNGNPVLVGQTLQNPTPFKYYPCDSRLMKIVVGNEWSELEEIDANDAVVKAVCLPYEETYRFLPLLHILP